MMSLLKQTILPLKTLLQAGILSRQARSCIQIGACQSILAEVEGPSWFVHGCRCSELGSKFSLQPGIALPAPLTCKAEVSKSNITMIWTPIFTSSMVRCRIRSGCQKYTLCNKRLDYALKMC